MPDTPLPDTPLPDNLHRGSAPDNPARVLEEVQREMLERLTGARWLLNPGVQPGTSWVHPAGPSDPAVGPDTTIPTYIIHPADLPACLAAIITIEPACEP